MTSTGRPARGRSRCQRPRGSAAVLTGWRRTVRRRVRLSSFGGDSYLPVLRPMRTQDVGWHRLRGFLTGVRGYVGAGAGLHWQHDRFGGGRRGETDRRCRGGDGERSQEESADVLQSTHHTCLPTGPASTTPRDESCFLPRYSVLRTPRAPTSMPSVRTESSPLRRAVTLSTFIVSSP